MPTTLVIKYIKKFPEILKNKSAQIKQLLDSLTDHQLKVVAEILEIDFNKLKTYKNNSISAVNSTSNVVNKGVVMMNNISKLLKTN